MRGIERRNDGRGRRASDRPGLWGRPYERALILASLLILSIAALLLARDQSRPAREYEALARQTLLLDARLHGEVTARQIADLERIVSLAGNAITAAGTHPLTAMEQAAATLPSSGLILSGAQGAPLAATGQGNIAAEGIHVRDGRLVVGRRLADDRLLSATMPLRVVSPQDANVRLEVRDASPLSPEIFMPDRNVILADHHGIDRQTVASLIGDTGLAVVADRPAHSLLQRVMDDARLLLLPLALGVVLLLFLVFRTFRHDLSANQWAETERRFRVAVEAAQCGVWDWDVAREHLSLSDYMAALLDLPAGAILTTEQMVQRIHPQYRDPFTTALHQARRSGQFDQAFPITTEDGGIRWIDMRGRSRGYASDGEFHHIMGIALDVTEARRAKARAKAAEDRLVDGIQSVSDAFVLFDRRGHLVMWNQAFQETFNFRPNALFRGAPKAELNRIAAQAILSEHRSDQRRTGVREIELKDGRWLQMTERHTADGGTVVIAADVTRIRHQEKERRRTTEELQRTVVELEASRSRLATLATEYEAAMTRAEAASQSKSEFLANMSHELRTPLNAINGFSEIMAGEMFGPLGDRRYKGYALDIHNSGKHLLSLINDILDMAKIEAGKLNLTYERTDMTALGREVVRLMRGRAEEAGLALALDAPGLIEADVDMRGIKQVLLNLVSNAIKFTPRAGRVMLEMRPLVERPGHVRVAVMDTGIGIAAEDLVRLAQPFVQVENQHAKTTQGTGLGLALTKSLIEMHGSTMVIESEPGHGTTVWFDLAMRAEKPSAQPPARQSSQPLVGAA